ncbi:Regulatory protein TenI [compost metagenome]
MERSALDIWEAVQQLLIYGVAPEKITVNDRLDIAWASGIGGVHLTSHSIPMKSVVDLPHGLRLGRSVHTVEEARRLAVDGADYLFYGHVYNSTSKPSLPPRGLSKLQEVTSAVSIPVMAIGGIGVQQIDEVLHHGAHGVAVISSILHVDDPVQAAQAIAHKLHERRYSHARE